MDHDVYPEYETQSHCCGAPRYGDWEICAECLEHCTFEEVKV
jgi:hypothetical protein